METGFARGWLARLRFRNEGVSRQNVGSALKCCGKLSCRDVGRLRLIFAVLENWQTAWYLRNCRPNWAALFLRNVTAKIGQLCVGGDFHVFTVKRPATILALLRFPSMANSMYCRNFDKIEMSSIFANYSRRGMGRKPTARRNSYGAWLHYLRKEAKLAQDDASRLTGIPGTTLTTWERTGEMPGREEIFRLAKAYNVSIPRLLRIEKLTQRDGRLRKKTG